MLDCSDSDDDNILGITDQPIKIKSKFRRSKPKFNELPKRRYQRKRLIPSIRGFIVNVHDATNFDIDLKITPDQHEQYIDVISNQYTYKDLTTDFLLHPNVDTLSSMPPEIGTTYRCRLRGVGIKQRATPAQIRTLNTICIEVKRLIDRMDGWVTCQLSDVDVFQRLLVDIYISTPTGSIDLRTYLLNRMQGDPNPVFYPYTGKRR